MICSDFCFRRKCVAVGVFQGEQGEARKLGGGCCTSPGSRAYQGTQSRLGWCEAAGIWLYFVD